MVYETLIIDYNLIEFRDEIAIEKGKLGNNFYIFR